MERLDPVVAVRVVRAPAALGVARDVLAPAPLLGPEVADLALGVDVLEAGRLGPVVPLAAVGALLEPLAVPVVVRALCELQVAAEGEAVVGRVAEPADLGVGLRAAVVRVLVQDDFSVVGVSAVFDT